MISRGTRGGGRGRRNLVLVQLQSCIHPSWICLFPPGWEQPTRMSAVVIPALSCAMLCSHPGPSLPLTPISLSTLAQPL